MSQDTTSDPKPEVEQTAGIYIQVLTPPGGATPQSVKGALKKVTPEQLQAVGVIVGDIQTWLFTKMSELTHQPKTFSLEFGIDVSGEAGIPFVTKGSIGANFKVSMQWESKQKKENQ